MLLRCESVESPMSEMGSISELDGHSRDVRFTPMSRRL
jgi:hypothetical protein